MKPMILSSYLLKSRLLPNWRIRKCVPTALQNKLHLNTNVVAYKCMALEVLAFHNTVEALTEQCASEPPYYKQLVPLLY